MPIAGLYVDGFNLYHAILKYEEPHLKWLNLRKLGESIIDSAETLGPVTYCTAYYPGNSQKKWRHDEYMAALRVVDVEPIMGHYIHEPWECEPAVTLGRKLPRRLPTLTWRCTSSTMPG